MSLIRDRISWWKKKNKVDKTPKTKPVIDVFTISNGVKSYVPTFYKDLYHPNKIYRVEGKLVYEQLGGGWLYTDTTDRWDFSNTSRWLELIFVDLGTGWDNYPAATHYCPAEMQYYMKIAGSVFAKITSGITGGFMGAGSYNILSEFDIKRLISRPKEENKMVGNMIGKISGVDWSKAPDGATHTGVFGRLNYWLDLENIGRDSFGKFYSEVYKEWMTTKNIFLNIISKEKDLEGVWEYYQSLPSMDIYRCDIKRVQHYNGQEWCVCFLTTKFFKELIEDKANWIKLEKVEMNKEARNKTVDESEVGMFVKFEAEHIYVVCPEGTVVNCQTLQVFPKWGLTNVTSYSHWKDGTFRPIHKKETEEQKKIRELEETINKAQEQIKELRNAKQ